MDKQLNRRELEDQLVSKAESISRRLDALQEEVGALSVRRLIDERPVVALIVVIAGGLLAGLLFGGRKRRRSQGAKTNVLHKELVQRYVDAVADDTHRLVARGKNVTEAVTRALRDRVPILVYQPDGDQDHGFVRQMLDLTVKAASGFLVKAALDFAVARAQAVVPGGISATGQEEEAVDGSSEALTDTAAPGS